MKRIITIVFSLFCISATFAQGPDDACRFSQTYYQGTAKALGMGNALGAVGGDMTAVSINPAGLGIYRSNEFTASLNLMDNFHSSDYYGSTQNANRFRLSIPNVGFVGTKERSNYRALRYTQFGIGLTRTNDFNMHTLSRGINPTSSKIDNYLAQIDGLNPDDFQSLFPNDIYPAWQTYLIDTIGNYYSSPVPQGNIWQGQDCDFKGRSEEWTFAGSANYFDKLFIGISANLAHIKREGVKVFNESHPDGADPGSGFNKWSFTENLRSTGWGGSVKVGFIYHANSWFRFGGAFHSPTIYAFTESWQTETESEINRITRKYISPQSYYEYTFISPLKWIGSMAFVVQNRGIISLDAEYQNYGAAKFTANDWNYDTVNFNIRNTYGRTLNFRLGSEWDLGGSYLRLGTAYYGSPLGLGKSDGSVKKASVGISLPAGTAVTFDFAYELTYGKNQITLYDAGNLGIEPVMQRQFKHLLLTTLKVRF